MKSVQRIFPQNSSIQNINRKKKKEKHELLAQNDMWQVSWVSGHGSNLLLGRRGRVVSQVLHPCQEEVHQDPQPGLCYGWQMQIQSGRKTWRPSAARLCPWRPGPGGSSGWKMERAVHIKAWNGEIGLAQTDLQPALIIMYKTIHFCKE